MDGGIKNEAGKDEWKDRVEEIKLMWYMNGWMKGWMNILLINEGMDKNMNENRAGNDECYNLWLIWFLAAFRN